MHALFHLKRIFYLRLPVIASWRLKSTLQEIFPAIPHTLNSDSSFRVILDVTVSELHEKTIRTCSVVNATGRSFPHSPKRSKSRRFGPQNSGP